MDAILYPLAIVGGIVAAVGVGGTLGFAWRGKRKKSSDAD